MEMIAPLAIRAQSRVSEVYLLHWSHRAAIAPTARLLDLRAAGKYIGVSYWTMRDMTLSGMLPVVRFPVPRAKDGRTIRRVLIDRVDLDRLIEQNKETE